MPDARVKLFAYKNIYDQKGTEKLFLDSIRDSVKHHKQNCPFYADLLKEMEFSEDQLKTIKDCKDIPFIPASFFKYHEVLSIDKEDIIVHATSSGTQGQKSQMFFDQSSLTAGVKMVTNMMRYNKFISLIPTNYIMLGYEPSKGNEMGSVKTALGITRFAPAKKKVFALRSTPNGYQADYFGIIETLKKYNEELWPVRILGFPSYLYFLLKMMKEIGIKPLKFNSKSMVLLGGGWKQFDDLTIEKDQLYSMVKEMLGIPKENCRDFYTAVEHSVPYGECKNHNMHVPIWSRVYIRDVKTLAPLDYGQKGFLNFVSPLVTSAPLTSVLMGDLAVMYDGKDCGCGIKTPYFKVLGRAGTSKLRSCAVAASELMKGG